MKDPNTPRNLKYSHFLQGQPADTTLPALLEELDSLYHLPQTPPYLTSFGFNSVKEQLNKEQETQKQKRRQGRYRLLLGGLVAGILVVILLALINNGLKQLFLGCFSFGLIFTLVSFGLGGLGHLGGFHLGAVGHSTNPLHASSHSASASSPFGSPAHNSSRINLTGGLGWFNLSALVVFLAWFGGTGFILVSLEVVGWLAVLLGIVAGVSGYMLILFLIGFLSASQTPLLQEQDYQLSGTVGQVSSSIRESGVGEVIYSRFGTRQSVPARTQDGLALPRGTQVVILSYSRGIAYVQDLNKLLSISTQEEQRKLLDDELVQPEDHSEQA